MNKESDCNHWAFTFGVVWSEQFWRLWQSVGSKKQV